ncbi:MAG: flagellar biosynthetic protein FliO [Bacteroidota bacterium]
MNTQQLLSQSTKKPQSILKMVLALAVSLLVVWLFLVSRMETGGSQQLLTTSASVSDSLNITVAEGLSPSIETRSERERPSLFQNASVTFGVLMVLLVGVWFWAKRKDKRTESGAREREIGQYILGQGAQLKFLEVNREVWVLALQAQQIQLLHRVPIDEWKEEGMLVKPDSASVPDQNTQGPDFSSLFHVLKN